MRQGHLVLAALSALALAACATEEPAANASDAAAKAAPACRACEGVTCYPYTSVVYRPEEQDGDGCVLAAWTQPSRVRISCDRQEWCWLDREAEFGCSRMVPIDGGFEVASEAGVQTFVLPCY